MADSQATLPIGSYETAASCPLGTVMDVGSRRFVYVQFLDAVTYVVGHVVSPAADADYKVSNDIAGGTTKMKRFAGAIVNAGANGQAITAVPTQNSYGWIQTKGYHSAIKTNGDDDIAQGDTIILGAADGVVDSVAVATTTGSLLKCGYAAAADVDADNTVATWLVPDAF